ncbi:MAG: hypothetical protein ACI4EM_09780, partial [Hominisplanchenecus sp.]
MRDKIKWILLVLSTLCVCLTAVCCVVSFWKVKEADVRIKTLESQISELEHAQLEKEEPEMVLETGSESELQTEMETELPETQELPET